LDLDKTLLSTGQSIGGLFLLVKGYFASWYFASKSRGWRCGWERKGSHSHKKASTFAESA